MPCPIWTSYELGLYVTDTNENKIYPQYQWFWRQTIRAATQTNRHDLPIARLFYKFYTDVA